MCPAFLLPETQDATFTFQVFSRTLKAPLEVISVDIEEWFRQCTWWGQQGFLTFGHVWKIP